MYALVDCNSFFCAVERVFHPGLRDKPVCVLSNNDGCIVALTPEAKRLGLHRGDPLFKVRDIVEHGGVTVFSTNMPLYAAMSARVTAILRKSVLRVENYSIDESFCDLGGYERLYDLEDYMRGVAEKIRLWTDIPVSVGIAPSKTLAKMGSKFAKQYRGYRSVCVIDTEAKRRRALELFPLADVWGIGRRTLARLAYYGVDTPLAFAEKSEAWVRARFTKPGVQTWKELNGIPCIDTSEVQRRQTICTSRSFGEMVESYDVLKESVVHFAASCANKLRGQDSVARRVLVFVGSNAFREDLEQYGNAASVVLDPPTSDTLEISSACMAALRQIYRPGIMYKRAGVVLTELSPALPLQLNLFDAIGNRRERMHLMRTIDALNRRYGVQSVHLATDAAEPRPWHVRCEHKSGNYLTDLDEILMVCI